MSAPALRYIYFLCAESNARTLHNEKVCHPCHQPHSEIVKEQTKRGDLFDESKDLVYNLPVRIQTCQLLHRYFSCSLYTTENSPDYVITDISLPPNCTDLNRLRDVVERDSDTGTSLLSAKKVAVQTKSANCKIVVTLRTKFKQQSLPITGLLKSICCSSDYQHTNFYDKIIGSCN